MTTENNKIEDRLSTGDGVAKESTVGISQDGFADPTGEYPRRYNWYGNSTSAAGRGVKINELWMYGSVHTVDFDVPIPTASIFPFNNANETPSGHSFEMDDTPGNERVLIKHHSGAGVELKQDGSVVVSSKSHRIEVVGSDHEVVVAGQGNITYDGDLNLTVNGDYNMTVNGNYNVKVGANENHSVNHHMVTETGGNHSTIVRSNHDLRTYGDSFEYYSGNKRWATKNSFRMISKKDIIQNARHIRQTAVERHTTSSGTGTTITSEKLWLSARQGKIGGDDFHFLGSLFTGPDDDNGNKTVFQGNLLGRALEAWTAKYSKYTEEAHSAHISNYATVASYSDEANKAGMARYAMGATVATSLDLVVPPTPWPDIYPEWMAGIWWDGADEMVGLAHPDYQFEWSIKSDVDPFCEWWLDYLPEAKTVWEHQEERLYDGMPISPFYVTKGRWFEVWNKTSPYAVRIPYVDEDNEIRNKISKIDEYSYYFTWTPDTAEVRSKLRTMDGANDPKTSPDDQTNGPKAILSLLQQNRLSVLYKDVAPPAPYAEKRAGYESPYHGPRFGYTLLGNPVERASKKFEPRNIEATIRTIVADPNYNPDKHDAPITSNTKLSKSSTVGKFLGAPGSKTSLDFIPIIKDRQDLARQWYLHAWLMEGVASAQEFKNYRLQVTEGYYHPAAGIREPFALEPVDPLRYWREPYRIEDGGDCQRSLDGYYINELKHNGRAVVYTLYNSRGKIDFGATFDLTLYIRDTYFFDQLSLDYDITRPDNSMSQQIIVVMPKIEKDFTASFDQKVCTYFNRKMYNGGDLVEITD
jgi:hypothetical protein